MRIISVMNENDELLDLVDATDTVVGAIRRGDMVKLGYKSPKGYVRFAVGFLLNDKNEVWVPIRGLHKSIAPGGCDFSVAEHVLSGETYEQAIVRAFEEEAGLRVDTKALTLIGKQHPEESKPTHEAIFVYFTNDHENPNFSREEFTSASWMALGAFEQILVSGPPTKSALLPAFRQLQDWLQRNR